jgi:hypothetical protein
MLVLKSTLMLVCHFEHVFILLTMLIGIHENDARRKVKARYGERLRIPWIIG